MKIMIVEDNPQMRQMIREVVADLADGVTECADGEAAVSAYAAQQFTGEDLVLRRTFARNRPGSEGRARRSIC